jgi:hypothetical protein
LQINATEAEAVRQIFAAYLELKSVRRLMEWLEHQGIKSKARPNCTGRAAGGAPFSKGALYYLLSNPVYIGKIRHRDKVHDGLHKPIMNSKLFDRVQEMLADQRVVRRQRSNAKSISPLSGKLFDETGDRLVPSHAAKGKVRYRYYVSQRLVDGSASDRSAWRLPALELEGKVYRAVLADVTFRMALQRAGASFDPDQPALLNAIRRIDIHSKRLVIELDTRSLLVGSGNSEAIQIETEFEQRRRGVELRLALAAEPNRQPDRTLVRAVHQAVGWVEELRAGLSTSVLAEREGIEPSYITQRLHLGLLSPAIVAAIVEGRQPASMTVQSLIQVKSTDWREQEGRLLHLA